MLVYPNVSRAHTLQLGILSLGSYLLNKGIDVKVCGMTFIPSDRYLNHLLANIQEKKPDIVGFLCPSQDAKTFAEKVIRLINNKKEAEKMGENGKKRILNEFGVERMIKETEDIYKKLLKQRIVIC